MSWSSFCLLWKYWRSPSRGVGWELRYFLPSRAAAFRQSCQNELAIESQHRRRKPTCDKRVVAFVNSSLRWTEREQAIPQPGHRVGPVAFASGARLVRASVRTAMLRLLVAISSPTSEMYPGPVGLPQEVSKVFLPCCAGPLGSYSMDDSLSRLCITHRPGHTLV